MGTGGASDRRAVRSSGVVVDAGRRAFLWSEGGLEGRDVPVEARSPAVVGGLLSGETREAGLPPGRIARRVPRRQLVGEDEDGAARGVRCELEAQDLVTPGVAQEARLLDLQHPSGEVAHVMRTKQERQDTADLPLLCDA